MGPGESRFGATLAAWRRLEHRQLGAGYRTFPDRALEPWNGEVRPFDSKQSLLTTAGQLRWRDFALGRQNHEQDFRQRYSDPRPIAFRAEAPSAEPAAAYPVGLAFRLTSRDRWSVD